MWGGESRASPSAGPQGPGLMVGLDLGGRRGPVPCAAVVTLPSQEVEPPQGFPLPTSHSLSRPRAGLGEQHRFAGKIQSRMFQALVCVLKQLNLSIHYEGRQRWAPGRRSAVHSAAACARHVAGLSNVCHVKEEVRCRLRLRGAVPLRGRRVRWAGRGESCWEEREGRSQRDIIRTEHARVLMRHPESWTPWASHAGRHRIRNKVVPGCEGNTVQTLG